MLPEYIWIIIAFVLFAIGMAGSYLFANMDKRKEIKRLQIKLEKVIQKAEYLERLTLKSNLAVKEKTKSFNKKSSLYNQLNQDILGLGDRLERIINASKNKTDVVRAKTVQEEEPKITTTKKLTDDNRYFDSSLNYLEYPITSSANKSDSQNYTFAVNDRQAHTTIVELYNKGVDDRSFRDLFRKNYAIVRLGNNKSVELRLGEVIEPEFQELDNGNFWAISDSDRLFYVLPRFDSTLNSAAYNEGGFSYVFDCPGYDAEITYTIVHVKHPAKFRRDSDNWSIIKKGELILQQ